MSHSLRWIIEDQPTSQAIQELRSHLAAYNVAHSHIAEEQEIVVFLRDENDRLAGGVVGTAWGEVLEINFLWVSDTLRQQGYGKRLLSAIEDQGFQRGCRIAVLDTYSFQAPEFYRRHGYEVYGTIAGYPDGHRKFMMKKSLTSDVDLS